MTTIGTPKLDLRSDQPYMGIRTLAPFVGMSKVIQKISQDLDAWIKSQHVQPCGPPFLRYHVIDMRGTMDIAFAYPLSEILPDDSSVTSGVLPKGRYASLIYSGGGIAGNRALIEWVRSQGLQFDRWDSPQGDNFRSRYETYLTDPSLEPRKTRWQIEVAIKLADEPA